MCNCKHNSNSNTINNIDLLHTFNNLCFTVKALRDEVKEMNTYKDKINQLETELNELKRQIKPEPFKIIGGNRNSKTGD